MIMRTGIIFTIIVMLCLLVIVFAQEYHYARADTSHDGCIDETELMDFMNKWKMSVADVSMPELMQAIGLWKAGTGCIN
jgi:hypothetical protein